MMFAPRTTTHAKAHPVILQAKGDPALFFSSFITNSGDLAELRAVPDNPERHPGRIDSSPLYRPSSLSTRRCRPSFLRTCSRRAEATNVTSHLAGVFRPE